MGELGRPLDELYSVDAMIAIEPSRARSWEWKAQILEKLGRAQDARNAIEQASRLGQADPEIWYNRGVDARSRGDESHARACFMEAVRLDPNHRDGWINLAN